MAIPNIKMIRVDVSGAKGGLVSFHCGGDSVDVISNSDILSALENHVSPDIESIYHVKCFYKGKKLDLHETSPNPVLSDSTQQRQKKVSVILTPRNAAEKIHAMKEANTRMPDIEYEFERERRRREYEPAGSGAKKNTRVGSLGAVDYAAVDVHPGAEEAVTLLQMVVDDPGIRHLMDLYDWNIGTVSEMPPDGFVGVSPVCILGVNIDCGREIRLRLRTDDLQGFRKFDMILSTMIHELAHMKYPDHDDDFKRFNRQLSMEARRMTSSYAQQVTQQSVKSYEGTSGAGTRSPQNRPHRFKETEWLHTFEKEARIAAGAAALRRNSSQAGPQSFRLPLDVDASNDHDAFQKGDDVLYFNKMANVWQRARIISVDASLRPPSYGIEIWTTDKEQPVQRETEASRLRKCGVNITGLGHDDDTTRQLEDKVATMFE